MKNISLLKNKKADEKTIIMWFALAAITFLLILFFVNKGFGGAKKNIDSKMNCQGGLGVGTGLCQASCDPPGQKYETAECTKSGLICCVTIGKKADLGIENYGGDVTHDFTVNYIGIDATNLATLKNTNKCISQNPGTDTILICPPDQTMNIIIKIGVTQSGTVPLDVFAAPTVVDLTGKYGQFELSGGISQTVSKAPADKTKAEKELLITFPLTKDGAKASSTLGTTYIIYAGAKCITTECKKTYTAGIFRKNNDDASLSITFQK